MKNIVATLQQCVYIEGEWAAFERISCYFFISDIKYEKGFVLNLEAVPWHVWFRLVIQHAVHKSRISVLFSLAAVSPFSTFAFKSFHLVSSTFWISSRVKHWGTREMEDIVSNYEIHLGTQGTVLNSVVTRRPVQKKSPSRKDWICTKNRAFIPGWTS